MILYVVGFGVGLANLDVAIGVATYVVVVLVGTGFCVDTPFTAPFEELVPFEQPDNAIEVTKIRRNSAFLLFNNI